MNVLMLLTNKASTVYISENDTLRDGISIMRSSGFTAIPVISGEGKYVGCVSEGDFLFKIMDLGCGCVDEIRVKDVIRPNFTPAVRIDVSLDELFDRAIRQNFIPVTDDIGNYIGIVTRKDIIVAFLTEYNG